MTAYLIITTLWEKHRLLIAAGIVFLIGAIHAFFIWKTMLMPKSGMGLGWDEAHHTMWGIRIYSEILHGKWLSFLFDTYRQVYWPFLHSWAIALAMILMGPEISSIRAISLVSFYVTAACLGIIAHRTLEGNKVLGIIVILGLWLTSGRYINAFATEPMLESLAIAMTGLAFLIMGEALISGQGWKYIGAGFFCMLTYFAKTDYGIILIGAMTFGLIWKKWDGFRGKAAKSLSLFLLPIIILSSIWFAYWPKVQATIAALINRPQGPDVYSIKGIVYHFEQLMFWAGAEWIFGVLIVCFLISFKVNLRRIIFMVILYIVIAIILHTISQTKDPKHIVKLLPWLILLTGLQVSRWWSLFKGYCSKAAIRVVIVAIIICGGYERISALSAETHGMRKLHTKEIAESISRKIQAGNSYFILGTFAELSPYFINWCVFEKNPQAWIEHYPDWRREQFTHKLNEISQRYPILKVFEKMEYREVFRLTYMEMKDRLHSQETLANELLKKSAASRIFILMVDENSVFNSEDYQKYHYPGRMFREWASRQAEYYEAWKEKFTEVGIEVVIFDKKEELRNGAGNEGGGADGSLVANEFSG